jgi:hypothetical protein
MLSFEVFVVQHEISDRGAMELRYATEMDAANELAAQPWGWYNGHGRVLPKKKVITIFETAFEVSNYSSEKEQLKRDIAKYESDLEKAKEKLRSL